MSENPLIEIGKRLGARILRTMVCECCGDTFLKDDADFYNGVYCCPPCERGEKECRAGDPEHPDNIAAEDFRRRDRENNPE